MTNADRQQAKALHSAHRAGKRPLEDALGVAVSAAMAAVIPGTQKKRDAIYQALRVKGYAAARRQLRRNPTRRAVGS